MLIPVITAALKDNPEVHFTVVTKGFNATLFKDIDRVQVVVANVYEEHKGVLGLYKLAKTLKKLDVNAVADMHQVLRSKVLRNYLRVMGMPVAVINKGRAQKKALTQPVKTNWAPLQTTHQRYAAVLQQLDLTVDLSLIHI